tara:strand:+ start:1678 stop:1854 length:177 start_codon:yes stop_codon:yes gene_type:complete
MTSNGVRNVTKRMQVQDSVKPAAMGTKGLLLKRSPDKMSKSNEPEAERLVRRVREMIK